MCIEQNCTEATGSDITQILGREEQQYPLHNFNFQDITDEQSGLIFDRFLWQEKLAAGQNRRL